MELATFLVDTREQKPWLFEDYPVAISRETLTTGDYALAEFCEYDEENDTYLPKMAVERKSGPDLLQSITHGRDRFKAEIKRAADWPVELKVIVEEPYTTFEKNMGFMQHRNVTPSQVTGTIETWGQHYNVDFSFAGTRRRAEELAFDTLLTYLRTVGHE